MSGYLSKKKKPHLHNGELDGVVGQMKGKRNFEEGMDDLGKAVCFTEDRFEIWPRMP